MDKKVFIRDYTDHKTEVAIKDFEKVLRLDVEIITGDEVLTVTYKDGAKISFDSCDRRISDYYDANYELPLDKVDEFSNFDGSSYHCAELFC